MEFFSQNANIDFMKLKGKAMAFSLILFVISLFGVWSHGLSFGLDFTGGTQILLRFDTVSYTHLTLPTTPYV